MMAGFSFGRIPRSVIDYTNCSKDHKTVHEWGDAFDNEESIDEGDISCWEAFAELIQTLLTYLHIF